MRDKKFDMTKIFKYLKEFFSLHFPEQIWIITHIFIAKKVRVLSMQARKIADEHKTDPELDGDYSGGMVDAFRHTLWMAMITQSFAEKVARSLGKVHEKGNKIDFKKKILEEKYLPDAVSCEMDLRNNEIGIMIGKTHKNASLEELIKIVKKAVLDGWTWKIKKDKNKNFLDVYNQKIPENQWKGKWFTPKTLIPTDFFVKK